MRIRRQRRIALITVPLCLVGVAYSLATANPLPAGLFLIAAGCGSLTVLTLPRC